jgi:ATP-dependent Clp protease ATP-binding subunit ClpX
LDPQAAAKPTESGYVGDDVLNILVQLVYAANENVDIAECGVVVLDEFDKIAGAYSNARFSGQGTTKDVSGYGVQRELLKILEGTDIQIPLDFGFSNRGPKAMMSTRDISFFAIGPFSGIKDIFDKYGMGFVQNLTDSPENKSGIAYKISDEEADDISQFHMFGFLPELIARFNRIIPFEPLDRNTLKDILILKVENYKREFIQEGYTLNIDSSLADLVVDESIKRQTGARGLDVLLTKHVEEVAFELFGKGDSGEIFLKADRSGKVSHQIKKRA